MKEKRGSSKKLQAAREQERVFGTNSDFMRKYGKFVYLDILVVLLAVTAVGFLNALLSALNLGLSLIASLAVALLVPMLYLGILYACRNRSPTYGILKDWWLRSRSGEDPEHSKKI